MNLELIKGGYPLVITPVKQKYNYYNNLDQIVTIGDYVPFVRQICDLAEQGFLTYLHEVDCNFGK